MATRLMDLAGESEEVVECLELRLKRGEFPVEVHRPGHVEDMRYGLGQCGVLFWGQAEEVGCCGVFEDVEFG
jgi:hypothetical protein